MFSVNSISMNQLPGGDYEFIVSSPIQMDRGSALQTVGNRIQIDGKVRKVVAVRSNNLVAPIEFGERISVTVTQHAELDPIGFASGASLDDLFLFESGSVLLVSQPQQVVDPVGLYSQIDVRQLVSQMQDLVTWLSYAEGFVPPTGNAAQLASIQETVSLANATITRFYLNHPSE